MIPWRPIDAVPERYREGEDEILVWYGAHAEVCVWSDERYQSDEGWITNLYGTSIDGVTHFAECDAVLASTGWRPIDTIPDDLRDGRDILTSAGRGLSVSCWKTQRRVGIENDDGWIVAGAGILEGPITQFMEINAP